MATDFVDVVKDGKTIRLPMRLAHFAPQISKYFYDIRNSIECGDVADFSEPSDVIYKCTGEKFKVTFLPEEPWVTETYFRHLPKRRELAFDLGAYCGFSTAEMAKRFTHVAALEPDSVNTMALRHNIAGYKNVAIHQWAVSSKNESLPFYAEGSLGSRLWRPEYQRGPRVMVVAVTLENLCWANGIPDFIKMDIEGEEINVLKSSVELLRRNNISLAIDTGHGNPPTANEAEEVLHSCGYRVETIDQNGMLTTLAWKE